jgi:hypothetical protein
MKQTIVAIVEIDDSKAIVEGVAEMLQVFLDDEIEGHYDNVTSTITINKKEENAKYNKKSI